MIQIFIHSVTVLGFMLIDFGSVKEYHPEIGLGIVGRTLSHSNEEVGFFIETIKNEHPELAQKLENNEALETVKFWYRVEINGIVGQLNKLWLNAENIPQRYTDELPVLIQEVESTWRNVDYPKPTWLDLVTIELVGADRRHELSVERDNLESQPRTAEEKRRSRETRQAEEERRSRKTREAEALRQNEIIKIVEAHNLTEEEADELHQLLTNMRPLNFTHSNQLSQSIVDNQLADIYPNISGIVRMEERGREWDFPGGFPSSIYRVICKELGLSNRRTSARPIGCTLYRNVNSKESCRNNLRNF